LAECRKKMTNTFATQQSTQQVKGRMSIWHGCSSPLGIVGGIF
jgi:hypothetical protein